MTDNTEKIKVLNYLINKFTESKTSFENDNLYNVLKDIRKDYQDPVIDDLKNEINRWLTVGSIKPKVDDYDIETTARHFANWQRKQMLNDALDGEVTYGKSLSIPSLAYVLDKNGLDFGDKVKLIIIKED